MSLLESPARKRTRRSPQLFRALCALVAMAALFVLHPAAASAASGPVEAASVIALDALCAEGLVINHQEQPLPGWTVTASYVGTESGASPQTAVSDENGNFRFDLPIPGRWLFTLAVPGDWVGVTATSFEIDVAFGATNCVPIRFKVQQEITVYVYKINDDHEPLAGWTIIATPGPGNTYTERYEAVTNDQGLATFVLPPGHWIFSERPPEGVTWWQPVMPADGVQELDVVAPGPYTIRFKNDVKEVVKGCIHVRKEDVPPGGDKGGQAGGEPFGLPDWPIEVWRTNGTLAAAGETNAFGEITFYELPLGPYTVRELLLDGWEPVTPTAYEVVLARTDDGCKEIVFKNKQKEKGFCIEGYKRDVFGEYGIPEWEIRATPVEQGGYWPDAVVTDGAGRFRIDLPFDDYRIPGAQYQVCEETRAGWTAVTPTCHTVTVPKYPGSCVVVPDFYNRQTNEQYDPPAEHQPKHQPKHEPKHQPKHEPKKHPGHGGHNPGHCSAYHTVARGESVYSIAPKYHMNGKDLLRANPWVLGQRNSWLYVGQKVCIP